MVTRKHAEDWGMYFSCLAKKSTKRMRHRRGAELIAPAIKAALSYVPLPARTWRNCASYRLKFDCFSGQTMAAAPLISALRAGLRPVALRNAPAGAVAALPTKFHHAAKFLPSLSPIRRIPRRGGPCGRPCGTGSRICRKPLRKGSHSLPGDRKGRPYAAIYSNLTKICHHLEILPFKQKVGTLFA